MAAENAVRELLQTGTFLILRETIKKEKDTLRGFWTTCIAIAKEQERMRYLKGELLRVWGEKWVKMAELDKEIFRLNDQLLEQNRRIHLEANLVEKQGVYPGQPTLCLT
ncbi:hypothetical protein ElyMa_000463000 [Elysia marginata]|uniref:Uncharacterized protein n=1 Tax=Elysia marginata TaxID=1093978 RepID=A0AAV4FQF6_9GAST|nr:hypothetical protein ElyMa_000463000 [Elysia marginata]